MTTNLIKRMYAPFSLIMEKHETPNTAGIPEQLLI
jgi:hypothetical protein